MEPVVLTGRVTGSGAAEIDVGSAGAVRVLRAAGLDVLVLVVAVLGEDS
jgi:hypothetical protein